MKPIARGEAPSGKPAALPAQARRACVSHDARGATRIRYYKEMLNGAWT